MKELSKKQVIELFKAINMEGCDDYVITDVVVTNFTPHYVFGCDDDISRLVPASYLAVWFNEKDLSDYPKLRDHIQKMAPENFRLYDNGDGFLAIFCLELF